jgi:hypothetical protein
MKHAKVLENSGKRRDLRREPNWITFFGIIGFGIHEVKMKLSLY